MQTYDWENFDEADEPVPDNAQVEVRIGGVPFTTCTYINLHNNFADDYVPSMMQLAWHNGGGTGGAAAVSFSGPARHQENNNKIIANIAANAETAIYWAARRIAAPPGPGERAVEVRDGHNNILWGNISYDLFASALWLLPNFAAGTIQVILDAVNQADNNNGASQAFGTANSVATTAQTVAFQITHTRGVQTLEATLLTSGAH